MRTAVELVDLNCVKTLSGEADEVSLLINGKPVWSSVIEGGQTQTVGAIKDVSESKAIVSAWQKTGPRTITCLGQANLLADKETRDGYETAEFSMERARYVLEYRRVEVSE